MHHYAPSQSDIARASHRSGVSDPAGRHVSYAYDSAGDLPGVTDMGGGKWAFWQMAAVEIVLESDTTTSGSPTTYAYDREGNRTKITPADSAETTLQYDQANRRTGYGAKAKYSYNGDGLGLSKTVDGTTTAFSWDQSSSLPLLLVDGNGYYAYGADNQPIEKISGTEAEDK
jgi:YD repeat-containing protein